MLLKSALAVMLAVTLTGCAYDTYGNRGGYGNNGSRNERAAYDSGYRDGQRQGRDDARDGDRYDPRGQRDYRTADNGRWGRYDDEYRDGFVRGYQEGYRDGRGNRGNGRGRRR